MKYSLLVILIWLLTSNSAAQTDDAKRLYQTYQDTIFQIRIREKLSGNKASIGSGFQISAQGHVVSNYHVVADVVHKPENYIIEYVAADGTTGELALLTVDVVNDLAILKHDGTNRPWLRLHEGKLDKGVRIFSLGNPRDLGMTVVEGTYNGLVDHNLYSRVLISGSLNPGMSGGPSIDRAGNVVGVNVATSGNQISFLVPVSHLKALYDTMHDIEYSSVVWDALLEQQLKQNQAQVVDALLDNQWVLEPLGDVVAPAEMASYVKCWGDTSDDEKALYEMTYRTCQVQDSLYLNQYLTTGTFRFQYQWLETKALNSVQFYQQMENTFFMQEANDAYREDVTPYQCHTDFIENAASHWKIHWCARRYKRFPSLFDIAFTMGSLANNHKGMVVNFAFAGIDQSNAKRLTQRFIESIRWTSL